MPTTSSPPPIPTTTPPSSSQQSVKPPFHPNPSLPNFRDIGGWPISSTTPKHVRPFLIFRGSSPTHLPHFSIQTLVSLGIRTVFDIRNASQVARLGFKDMSDWGVERVWVPVFAESEDGEGEGKDKESKGEKETKRRYELYASDDVKDIVEAFIEILISGARMMSVVMRHLITSTSTPASSTEKPSALFIHCTTGNNRTGVFVAVLLLLLNVPVLYIVTEYSLSEIGLASTRHVNVSRLLAKGAFAELGEVEAKRRCERMVGARKESMEGLLAEVERKWGGAEGYFLDVVGLTTDEVKSIKEILTAEGEGTLSHWTEGNDLVS